MNETITAVSTSKGRIDLVMNTDKRIYIFEFKINSNPQVALQQMETQQYYEKYLRFHKPISLIDLAFNFKKKELRLDYVIKDMQTIDKKQLTT